MRRHGRHAIQRQRIRLLHELQDRNQRTQTERSVKRDFQNVALLLFRANQKRVSRFCFHIYLSFNYDAAESPFCLIESRFIIGIEDWMQRRDDSDSKT